MDKNLVDLNELSLEEIEALRSKKVKEQIEAREKEKAEYEAAKDTAVKTVITEAQNIASILKDFKQRCHELLNEHKERLDAYGKIRSNSKGGFSLLSSCGNYKLVRRLATSPNWDERSTKAVELISDFLRDTVKKKDVKLFEILYSFIEKNKNGDLEYSKVMQLLQHKDKYNDPRWLEGLELIQESYTLQFRAFSYEFFIKDIETQEFERLEINFSAI